MVKMNKVHKRMDGVYSHLLEDNAHGLVRGTFMQCTVQCT